MFNKKLFSNSNKSGPVKWNQYGYEAKFETNLKPKDTIIISDTNYDYAIESISSDEATITQFNDSQWEITINTTPCEININWYKKNYVFGFESAPNSLISKAASDVSQFETYEYVNYYLNETSNEIWSGEVYFDEPCSVYNTWSKANLLIEGIVTSYKFGKAYACYIYKESSYWGEIPIAPAYTRYLDNWLLYYYNIDSNNGTGIDTRTINLYYTNDNKTKICKQENCTWSHRVLDLTLEKNFHNNISASASSGIIEYPGEYYGVTISNNQITINYSSIIAKNQPHYSYNFFDNVYELTAITPTNKSISCVLQGLNYFTCLSINTKITLANDTTKLFRDLTINDEVLVWDFDNSCYTTTKLLTLSPILTAPRYYKITTNTGRELDCIGNQYTHRVYSIEKGKFEYPQNCIGDTIYTEDGYETIVSGEWIEEPIQYRNAISYYHMNLFGNSILTSCGFNNIYPIKDMKFIKEDREVREKEEFNLPDKWYYGMRLSEQYSPKEEILDYINYRINNWEVNENV